MNPNMVHWAQDVNSAAYCGSQNSQQARFCEETINELVKVYIIAAALLAERGNICRLMHQGTVDETDQATCVRVAELLKRLYDDSNAMIRYDCPNCMAQRMQFICNVCGGECLVS